MLTLKQIVDYYTKVFGYSEGDRIFDELTPAELWRRMSHDEQEDCITWNS